MGDSSQELLTDTALRADIRLLGNLLGETLVRQVGPELLEIVESIRVLTKRIRATEEGAEPDQSATEELEMLLNGLDLVTATRVVRAFATFFHLANLAEQSHRLDQQGALSARGSIGAAADRSSMLRSRPR